MSIIILADHTSAHLKYTQLTTENPSTSFSSLTIVDNTMIKERAVTHSGETSHSKDCVKNKLKTSLLWPKTPECEAMFVVLKIMKTDETAYIPTRASCYSAGCDLRTPKDFSIPARERLLVDSLLKIQLPPEVYGRIAPRSGTSLKVVYDPEVGDAEKANKIWKVMPLFRSILRGCQAQIRTDNISIDEMIIPFTGHCGIRQFCPRKPNPMGIKIFVLANPNGIVCDMTVYQREIQHSLQILINKGLPWVNRQSSVYVTLLFPGHHNLF
ncbi:hypothetical protein JTB14_021249 [Gonioctena quinquepunctata]|nr:hypothetical protein JTB14_021249 [Gonioctena quinquepunctata]